MIRTSTRRRRGATTIEFAFTLPIVLLMFFGFIEATRANMVRNSAKNAAYMAARRAIIPGGTASDAVAKGESILKATGVRSGVVTVAPSVVDEDTPQVTVTVSAPMNENSWVVPKFFADAVIVQSCTLTREASQSGF
ncbi:MAG: pilus assembly protein [Planctomycetales bacterium]|nr:pilus assembly protein [Planctomycetales bacterium]